MNVKFKHAILDGTPYEVGQQQGRILAGVPEAAIWLYRQKDQMQKEDWLKAEKAMTFFNRHCPGLNDEIQGFADSLCIKTEQVTYYNFSTKKTGNCSHFAVLPSMTADGHLYVGRNYEWSSEDELRLCTTRIKGRAAHIGFTVFQFGRFDGLNEHGLSVTISAGVPGSNPESDGCMFWAIIRTVLERCKTVEEALNNVMDIPTCFNWNLILADRQGKAALVEIACEKREIKRIDENTPDKFLCATNHYTLPGMLPHDSGRMWQSVARYNAIEKTLCTAVPAGRETLRKVLSSPVPEGTCCHYYSDGLGTLWSMIFDVTDSKAEVCFGSPMANPWRIIGFGGEVGVKLYDAVLPDEKAGDPALFYKRLEPGSGI